ncbi:hypothetical protein [Brevundimonas vesicularis]|uniref:hypothetical protein n=1 Tax=Brevundimonas vesicularis TaxID=41276 RepID=UPI0022AC433F|nr:hypothetical protein [Brevundimonas vesicularis]
MVGNIWGVEAHDAAGKYDCGSGGRDDYNFTLVRRLWPAEVVNIRYVMANGCRLKTGDYSIESGRLLTRGRYETDGLQIVATVRAHESTWPGDLSEAIVTRLQALFLEALCDKPQDARLKERDADQKLRDAIVRDKRQEPGVAATASPLADVWRGGRARRF